MNPNATPTSQDANPLDVPLAFPEIVALYERDVDRTLLRENLKLTPAQRLAKLESAHRSLAILRTARPKGQPR